MDGTLTNAGRIQAHGADIATANNSWPFVCDWNRDGRKDLLVGQEGIGSPSNVYVYLNQGIDSLPVFGDSTPVRANGSLFNNYRCIPLLLDLDNDGRRDLILGEWYSSVRLYPNSGTDSSPVFTTYTNLVEPDPVNFVNGNPPRVNFTDWDGDGDLDMITCDYYGSVFLRRNITPTGVAESEPNRGHRNPNALPGIVRNVLFIPDALCPNPSTRLTLLDAAGRPVAKLAPGANSLRGLGARIYFVRQGGPSSEPARKVILVD